MPLPDTAVDHYRQQQRLTLQVLAYAREVWGKRPPANFDAWFDRNVDQLMQIVVEGQMRAVKGADSYVGDTLAELGTPVSPDAVINPEAMAGVASSGRPLDGLMFGAVINASERVEDRGALQAWESGFNWLAVVLQTQLADISRSATQLGVASRKNVGYVRMLNPPSCSRCAILAGRFYRYNAAFRRHPGCFPAGTVVNGPSVDAATRRWYEGELIVFTTASGQKLSLTGNHPILTRRGWIPANLLSEGDEVFRSTLPDGATPLVVPDHNQVPALIEDIWDSFSVSGFRRVPTAPEDFHGDGQHGEVDIVYPNRTLSNGFKPSIFEHGGDIEFGVGAFHSGEFVQEGLSEFVDMRSGAHSGSSVGRSGLELPFIGRHVGNPNGSGLAPSAWFDTSLDEAFANHFPRNSVLATESVFARTGFVGQEDLVEGDRGVGGFESRWDAPALPFSMETRAGYASRGNDLVNRLSGQVEADRIVQLSRVDFSGHVYNLTSSEGWHTANSLIVSNCDCRAIPSREDSANDLVTDPNKYFNSLSKEQQDRIFTKSGAEAIRLGADIGQVVNVRKGAAGLDAAVGSTGRLTRTDVYGQSLYISTEGVTKRGVAGKVIRARGRDPRTTPRLMPESILEIAESREDALRLLKLNGFILDRSGPASGVGSRTSLVPSLN